MFEQRLDHQSNIRDRNLYLIEVRLGNLTKYTLQHSDSIPVKGPHADETRNWLVCKKDKNYKNTECD